MPFSIVGMIFARFQYNMAPLFLKYGNLFIAKIIKDTQEKLLSMAIRVYNSLEVNFFTMFLAECFFFLWFYNRMILLKSYNRTFSFKYLQIHFLPQATFFASELRTGELKKFRNARKMAHLSFWSCAFNPESHTPQRTGKHPITCSCWHPFVFMEIYLILSLDQLLLLFSIQELLIFCPLSFIFGLRCT